MNPQLEKIFGMPTYTVDQICEEYLPYARILKPYMAETAQNPGEQVVFISHGDCLADAQKVADDVKARFGVKTVVINYVGPVIGAHSGPGTVALFFLGSVR